MPEFTAPTVEELAALSPAESDALIDSWSPEQLFAAQQRNQASIQANFARARAARPPISESLPADLARGYYSTKGGFAGAADVGATLLGADTDYFRNVQDAAMQKAASYKPAVGSFVNVDPSSPADIGRYFLEAGAENAVQLGTSLIPGGAARLAVPAIATRIGIPALKAGALGTRAAAGVAAASNIAQETGGIAGDVRGTTGAPLTYPQALASAGTGIVAGALETIGDIPLLKSLFPDPVARSIGQSWWKRTGEFAGKAGLKGFEQGLLEFATEYPQSVVESVPAAWIKANKTDDFWKAFYADLTSDRKLVEYLDSGLKGFGAGGPHGAGAYALGQVWQQKVDDFSTRNPAPPAPDLRTQPVPPATPTAPAPPTPGSVAAAAPESWADRMDYRDVTGKPASHRSTAKYAAALNTQKPEEVNAVADKLRGDFDVAMTELGVQPSIYGKSQSWSIWDIGKQLYLAANPKESSPEYRLANPLTDQPLQREMLARMVGYELWMASGVGGKVPASSELTKRGEEALQQTKSFKLEQRRAEMAGGEAAPLGSQVPYDKGQPRSRIPLTSMPDLSTVPYERGAVIPQAQLSRLVNMAQVPYERGQVTPLRPLTAMPDLTGRTQVPYERGVVVPQRPLTSMPDLRPPAPPIPPVNAPVAPTPPPLAPAGAPARFVQSAGPFRDEVLVTKSAKKPGKWQATLFKDNGNGTPLEPSGDAVFDTRDEAMRSAKGETVNGIPGAGSRTFIEQSVTTPAQPAPPPIAPPVEPGGAGQGVAPAATPAAKPVKAPVLAPTESLTARESATGWNMAHLTPQAVPKGAIPGLVWVDIAPQPIEMARAIWLKLKAKRGMVAGIPGNSRAALVIEMADGRTLIASVFERGTRQGTTSTGVSKQVQEPTMRTPFPAVNGLGKSVDWIALTKLASDPNFAGAKVVGFTTVGDQYFTGSKFMAFLRPDQAEWVKQDALSTTASHDKSALAELKLGFESSEDGSTPIAVVDSGMPESMELALLRDLPDKFDPKVTEKSIKANLAAFTEDPELRGYVVEFIGNLERHLGKDRVAALLKLSPIDRLNSLLNYASTQIYVALKSGKTGEAIIGWLDTVLPSDAQAGAGTPPQVAKPAVVPTQTSAPGTKLTAAEQSELTALKKRLREKLGRVNSGIDPEILTIAAQMASLYAKDGVRRFKDYASRMKEELPEIWESVKRYLHGAWQAAGASDETLDDVSRGEAAKLIADIDAPVAPAAPANAKQAEEERELQFTIKAREIAQGPGTNAEKYAQLVSLYRSAPKFGIRTAESKTNQAYSTPPPLAFLAGLMADLQNGTKILEPTAGNGMLLISAPEGARILANELDPQRAARLKRSMPTAIIRSEDATSSQFQVTARMLTPDRVVANPPFGSVMDATGEGVKFPIFGAITAKTTTPSIDLAIMLNALETMAPDGKAVILIGSKTGTPFASFGTTENRAKGYQRQEFLELFKRFNVVDMFTVDGALYEGMGAGWPVDVIVVDGKRETASSQNGGMARPWVKPPPVFNSWQELEKKVVQYEHNDSNRAGGKPAPVNRLPDRGTGATVGEGGRGPGTSRLVSARPELGNPPVRADAVVGGKPVGQGGDNRPGGGVTGQPAGGGVPTESPRPAGPAAQPAGQAVGGAVSGGAVQPARAERTEGQLNVPYESASKNVDTKLVVPTNLADPIRAALTELEQAEGKSVDQYVADKLGWSNKLLYSFLSAAQIDAVALGIRNIDRGSALINGDQTGVGKGRTAAAIIYYAIRIGKVPIFVTAKKALYDDMVGRDLAKIGIKTFNPFITDTNYQYTNGQGDLIVSKTSKKDDLEFIAANGKLPAGYNAFFTTYGQLKSDRPTGFKEESKDKAKRKKNREAKPDGPRYAALRALAPNAVFILDEAHVAAGQSSDLNIKLQEELLQLAHGVYMLTATFSKRPDNLGLYSVPTLISRAGLSTEALVDLLKRGGNALQQALSSMLAQSGEFLRREQNYAGVNIRFVAATKDVRAETEAADTYTSFLGDLKRLSAMVNAAVESVADEENQVRPEGSEVNIVSQNFGSRLFNLSQQYLMALRTESVVAQALKVLQEPRLDANGKVVIGKDGKPAKRKPFITLYNTMSGPITDLQKMGLPFSFNGILLREMEKMLKVKVRDPMAPANHEENLKAGERWVILKPEDLPDGGNFYRELEAQIKSSDLSGFPISPIDFIKNALKDAGYNVGEITGRNGELTVDADGDPVFTSRETAERNEILKNYNSGALDVLVVNGAGSTGISAHTDPNFGDQRQRVMIVAQPQPDITEMMQMLGRVMRFGQATLPDYVFLRSSLAAEKRFLTMLRGKLASLNANTSADTESEVTKQEDFAEDIFNEIGDEVVFRVLQAHPEAVELAQIKMPEAEKGKIPEITDFARKATGQFVLLPNADSQALWDEIDDAYRNEIKLLDEIGENPLKATPEDLQAERLSATEYVAGDGNTLFDGPATLEKVKTKLTNKPFTHAEASQLAEQNEDKVRKAVNEWLQGNRTAERERASTAESRGATPEQLDRIHKTFQDAREKVSQAFSRIGQTYGVDTTGNGQAQLFGVVVDIRLRGKESSDFSSASKQEIVLATNTVRRTVTFAVSKTEGGDKYLNQIQSESDQAAFDSTAEVNTDRYVVTGNILRGFEQAMNSRGERAKPRVVVFTRKDGSIETGILMPPDFDPAKQEASTQKPLRSGVEFAAAVRNSVPVAAGEVRIIDGELTVPSNSQWRKVWGNPRFKEFVRYAEQSGSVLSGRVDQTKLAEMYQWLSDIGFQPKTIGEALRPKLSPTAPRTTDQPIAQLIYDNNRNRYGDNSTPGQPRSADELLRAATQNTARALASVRGARSGNQFVAAQPAPEFALTETGRLLTRKAEALGVSLGFITKFPMNANGVEYLGAVLVNVENRTDAQVQSAFEHELAHVELVRKNPEVLALNDLVDANSKAAQNFKREYEAATGQTLTPARVADEIVAAYVSGDASFRGVPLAQAFRDAADARRLAGEYHNPSPRQQWQAKLDAKKRTENFKAQLSLEIEARLREKYPTWIDASGHVSSLNTDVPNDFAEMADESAQGANARTSNSGILTALEQYVNPKPLSKGYADFATTLVKYLGRDEVNFYAHLYKRGPSDPSIPGIRLVAGNATITAPGVTERLAVTAHHGTPHKVDKFSTSKIGTGEGAQVYGYGIYFAENPAVADNYRKTLSRKAGAYVDGKPAKELGQATWEVADGIASLGGSVDAYISQQRLRRGAAIQDSESAGNGKRADILRSVLAEEIAIAESLRSRKVTRDGNTYTVSLKVEPEDLLLWDRPLSEQSEKVKAALLQVADLDGSPELGDSVIRAIKAGRSNASGETIYHSLVRVIGASDSASNALLKAGVKGVKYADQLSRINTDTAGKWNLTAADGSPIGVFANKAMAEAEQAKRPGSTVTQREAQEGTSNYVIFDENDIEITHENGQPVTMREAMGTPDRPLFSAQQDQEYMAATRGDNGADPITRDTNQEEWARRNPQSAKVMRERVESGAKSAGSTAFPTAETHRPLFIHLSRFDPKSQKMEDAIVHPNTIEDIGTRKELGKKGLRVIVKHGGNVWSVLRANNTDFFKNYDKLKQAAGVWYDHREGDKWLESEGHVKIASGMWTPKNPSQIKSADLATFDDAGNLIPPSQRFNSQTPDMRYAPADVLGEKGDTLIAERGVAAATGVASLENATQVLAPVAQRTLATLIAQSEVTADSLGLTPALLGRALTDTEAVALKAAMDDRDFARRTLKTGVVAAVYKQAQNVHELAQKYGPTLETYDQSQSNPNLTTEQKDFVAGEAAEALDKISAAMIRQRSTVEAGILDIANQLDALKEKVHEQTTETLIFQSIEEELKEIFTEAIAAPDKISRIGMAELKQLNEFPASAARVLKFLAQYGPDIKRALGAIQNPTVTQQLTAVENVVFQLSSMAGNVQPAKDFIHASDDTIKMVTRLYLSTDAIGEHLRNLTNDAEAAIFSVAETAPDAMKPAAAKKFNALRERLTNTAAAAAHDRTKLPEALELLVKGVKALGFDARQANLAMRMFARKERSLLLDLAALVEADRMATVLANDPDYQAIQNKIVTDPRLGIEQVMYGPGKAGSASLIFSGIPGHAPITPILLGRLVGSGRTEASLKEWKEIMLGDPAVPPYLVDTVDWPTVPDAPGGLISMAAMQRALRDNMVRGEAFVVPLGPERTKDQNDTIRDYLSAAQDYVAQGPRNAGWSPQLVQNLTINTIPRLQQLLGDAETPGQGILGAGPLTQLAGQLGALSSMATKADALLIPELMTRTLPPMLQRLSNLALGMGERGKLAINALIKANSPRVQELFRQAVLAHEAEIGGNTESYDTLIFDQLAPSQQDIHSPVKYRAGDIIGNGMVVKAEDLALMLKMSEVTRAVNAIMFQHGVAVEDVDAQGNPVQRLQRVKGESMVPRSLSKAIIWSDQWHRMIVNRVADVVKQRQWLDEHRQDALFGFVAGAAEPKFGGDYKGMRDALKMVFRGLRGHLRDGNSPLNGFDDLVARTTQRFNELLLGNDPYATPINSADVAGALHQSIAAMFDEVKRIKGTLESDVTNHDNSWKSVLRILGGATELNTARSALVAPPGWYAYNTYDHNGLKRLERIAMWPYMVRVVATMTAVHDGIKQEIAALTEALQKGTPDPTGTTHADVLAGRRWLSLNTLQRMDRQMTQFVQDMSSGQANAKELPAGTTNLIGPAMLAGRVWRVTNRSLIANALAGTMTWARQVASIWPRSVQMQMRFGDGNVVWRGLKAPLTATREVVQAVSIEVGRMLAGATSAATGAKFGVNDHETITRIVLPKWMSGLQGIADYYSWLADGGLLEANQMGEQMRETWRWAGSGGEPGMRPQITGKEYNIPLPGGRSLPVKDSLVSAFGVALTTVDALGTTVSRGLTMFDNANNIIGARFATELMNLIHARMNKALADGMQPSTMTVRGLFADWGQKRQLELQNELSHVGIHLPQVATTLAQQADRTVSPFSRRQQMDMMSRLAQQFNKSGFFNRPSTALRKDPLLNLALVFKGMPIFEFQAVFGALFDKVSHQKKNLKYWVPAFIAAAGMLSLYVLTGSSINEAQKWISRWMKKPFNRQVMSDILAGRVPDNAQKAAILVDAAATLVDPFGWMWFMFTGRGQGAGAGFDLNRSIFVANFLTDATNLAKKGMQQRTLVAADMLGFMQRYGPGGALTAPLFDATKGLLEQRNYKSIWNVAAKNLNMPMRAASMVSNHQYDTVTPFVTQFINAAWSNKPQEAAGFYTEAMAAMRKMSPPGTSEETIKHKVDQRIQNALTTGLPKPSEQDRARLLANMSDEDRTRVLTDEAQVGAIVSAFTGREQTLFKREPGGGAAGGSRAGSSTSSGGSPAGSRLSSGASGGGSGGGGSALGSGGLGGGSRSSGSRLGTGSRLGGGRTRLASLGRSRGSRLGRGLSVKRPRITGKLTASRSRLGNLRKVKV